MERDQQTVFPLPSIDSIPPNAAPDNNDARSLALADFEPYLSSLKSLPIWIGWEKVPDENRPGKFRKPPRSPVNGSAIAPVAKYQDHWLPFADAWPGILRFGLEGPGLVFREQDGLVGIDIDNCVSDDGIIDPAVVPWVKQWFAHTYAEFSPSGRGIHIIGRGRIPKALTATQLPSAAAGVTVEAYFKERFFTLTARPVSL